MNKILVISTGGTIASSQTEVGIQPTLTGANLLRKVSSLNSLDTMEINIMDLFSKDSINMTLEDWFTIASRIRHNQEQYDGFLILHGTGTMGYLSSFLSFTMRNFSKPIVITGAMKPISLPGSDVKDNVINSFLFLKKLIKEEKKGVSICFANKLIHGPRAKKIRWKDNDAFESINYPYIGSISNSDIKYLKQPEIRSDSFPFPVNSTFEQRISIIKLFPGFMRTEMESFFKSKPKAIVVETYGTGGVPYLGENILTSLKMAREKGIPTVITSQCLYDGVDLSLYEVGRNLLDLGVISGLDMTFESIITKLIIGLPNLTYEEVKDYMYCNLCDELNDNLISCT